MKLDKITRVLYLYHLLREGKKVNKFVFSMDCEVSERGFDRDIQDIRLMLSDMGIYDDVMYDKIDNTYHLSDSNYHPLEEAEAFVFAKLLLDSKVFRKDETESLLEALVSVTDKHKRKSLVKKIAQDIEVYPTGTDKKANVKLIRDLSDCIINGKQIALHYDHKSHKIKPTNMFFGENGFVLHAEDEAGKEKVFPIEQITEFQII